MESHGKSAEVDSLLGAVELPKWPQMVVNGEAVSQDQARDIIIRTDPFFSSIYEVAGGNDFKFTDWYQKLSGVYDARKALPDFSFSTLMTFHAVVQDALDAIPLNCINNDWASTCFIFGPHGWCHPDGKIGYCDNVGKWPEARELYDDWSKVASAFPYLDVLVTFMSGESCDDDAEPALQFVVQQSSVRAITESFAPFQRRMRKIGDVLRPRIEKGLPMEWFDEPAAKIRAALKEHGYLR